MIADVEMINRARAIVVTDDGQELPITDAFDAGGVTCDLAGAVTCVAGPDSDGRWYAIDLTQFEGVTLQ